MFGYCPSPEAKFPRFGEWSFRRLQV